MAVRAMLHEYVKWVDCQYWHVTNDPPIRSELHCHGHYELILALTDDILHRVNGVMQVLAEGTLVFIRPDDVHEFMSIPGKRQEFICFSMTKAAFERFLTYMEGTDFPGDRMLNAPMPPMCRLSKYEKEHLYIKIQDLSFLHMEDRDRINTKFRMLLSDIFSHFYEENAVNYSDIRIPDWLDTTCNKMKLRENFSQGVTRMLALSGKSPEHLSRSVKKHYGVTPSEYINQLRLNFAANQLLTTSLSVLDICFECGFDSTAYFHKKFKEKFGITPLQFRKNQ